MRDVKMGRFISTAAHVNDKDRDSFVELWKEGREGTQHEHCSFPNSRSVKGFFIPAYPVYYDKNGIIYDKPIKPMKEKALFLDLDGTLIRTRSGNKYPENIDDWEFMSRKVLIAIKKYSEAGFHICIVANDGGIELGHYTKEQIETKLDCIGKELEQYIGQTVNYAFCGNMESYMRKPNPGMAYRFALELELSLRDSVMVGNTETDAKFAKNAYIGTYLDVEDFMKEQFVRDYSTPDTRTKQK